MKKFFEVPEVEFHRISVEDVITASLKDDTTKEDEL